MKFEKVSYNEFKTHFPTDLDEKRIMEMWESIRLPERATEHSAGYDFFVYSPLIGTKGFYPTGIKIRLDPGTFLMLVPRSSLGIYTGFRLQNTVGIIDADYYNNEENEGHILVGFDSQHTVCLKTGDKLCQGIIIPYAVTDDDNATAKRTGGFGSTDEALQKDL